MACHPTRFTDASGKVTGHGFVCTRGKSPPPMPATKPFRMGTFDCEVQKDPGSVGGWSDYRGMGVAIVAVLDHAARKATGDYGVMTFGPTQVGAAMEFLLGFDMLSTFNGLRFDVPLMEACSGMTNAFLSKPHYDVWKELDRAGAPTLVRGVCNLEAVAQANLGRTKTGHGKDAPMLFQTGQIEKLSGYAVNDCRLEADLVRLCERGWIYDGTGRAWSVRKPSAVWMDFLTGRR